MKFESHHEVVIDRVGIAFERAVADTLEEAVRIAPHVTGQYARSLKTSPVSATLGRLEANLGSTSSSAKTKEKGAYIQARNAPWLAIPRGDGTIRKVKAVRIPPRPVVSKAGPRFIEFFTKRLQEGS